jgi:hypothetical protein
MASARRARSPSPIPAPDEAALPPRHVPDRALPPYRFVPGLHPHPTRHPDGHSRGLPEPPVRHVAPDDWAVDAQYLFGVDLFNRRYYWEAHEAWETVWHACDRESTQGRFVQGLILVAAALLQWFMGSPEGLERQHAKARRHLEPAAAESPRSYMGLPLAAWLAETDACVMALRAAKPPEIPANISLPVIRLMRYNRGVPTP